MLPCGGLEILSVALVTNEIFVAPLQLLAQVLDDRFAVGRILATLFFIEADDIASVLDDHLFDFQGRRVFGPLALGSHLPVATAVGQDPLAHFLHRPHARP